MSSTEVWVLGATGRSGRAVATALLTRGIDPVLVGRDAVRLEQASAEVGGGRTVVTATVELMAEEIRRQQPAVVINTVGPYTATAVALARACLPSSHYVDLANDVAAVLAVLDLDEAAAAAGRCVVTGAGFGVTATESVVVALCAGRPAPVRVRVDMIPSLEVEAGPVGEALAGTILDGLPGVPGGGRFQGRRYEGGHLVPARIGGDVAHLTLPDGSRVSTVGMPLGELVAAQRASGAACVVSASSEIPSSPVARAVLPLATAVLARPRIRAYAKGRLARMRMRARPQPRPRSWGHARLEWADGTVREGWLGVGEAQAYTGAVPAEIARRLLAGEGRPGAHTPAALFGPGLAEACGGEYLIDDPATHPTNTAAWLGSKHGGLEVGPAPYPRPRAHEVVVGNRAVAVNPVDWMVPAVGGFVYPWLSYPAVLGSDVAGEVVEVGSAVTRFRPGDRVLGHAVGTERGRDTAAEGAFQTYPVLLDHLMAKIPDDLEFEQAAVLPLGLSTAACALFEPHLLGLRLPTAGAEPTGQTVLVWGASTSVGSNAVQLAVAAGYDVVATASPHNAGYVRGLGAAQVLDYRSATAVRDVVEALQGRPFAGAVAVGAGSSEACVDVVRAVPGTKVVAAASPSVSFATVTAGRGRWRRLVPVLLRLGWTQAALVLKARRTGVRTTFIWGGALKDDEIGPAIYVDFLPRALADGSYVAAPPPLVVGHGLDQVETALAVQRAGVSAQKVVLTL